MHCFDLLLLLPGAFDALIRLVLGRPLHLIPIVLLDPIHLMGRPPSFLTSFSFCRLVCQSQLSIHPFLYWVRLGLVDFYRHRGINFFPFDSLFSIIP